MSSYRLIHGDVHSSKKMKAKCHWIYHALNITQRWIQPPLFTTFESLLELYFIMFSKSHQRWITQSSQDLLIQTFWVWTWCKDNLMFLHSVRPPSCLSVIAHSPMRGGQRRLLHSFNEPHTVRHGMRYPQHRLIWKGLKQQVHKLSKRHTSLKQKTLCKATFSTVTITCSYQNCQSVSLIDSASVWVIVKVVNPWMLGKNVIYLLFWLLRKQLRQTHTNCNKQLEWPTVFLPYFTWVLLFVAAE